MLRAFGGGGNVLELLGAFGGVEGIWGYSHVVSYKLSIINTFKFTVFNCECVRISRSLSRKEYIIIMKVY